MKSGFMKIAVCLPLLAMTLSASAISLNTGTADWKVTKINGLANTSAGVGAVGSAATTTAVVLTGVLPFAANLPGFEQYSFANPFDGAVWIGQNAGDGNFTGGLGVCQPGLNCGGTQGDYVYTLTFDGSFGGSLALSGFTGDNGILSLVVSQTGGPDLYSCSASGPGTLCAPSQHEVTAPTGTLNFSASAGRQITITALARNLDGPGRNPTGFVLAGTANLNPASAPIPEPSTWAMFGVGVAALAASGLKRRG